MFSLANPIFRALICLFIGFGSNLVADDSTKKLDDDRLLQQVKKALPYFEASDIPSAVAELVPHETRKDFAEKLIGALKEARRVAKERLGEPLKKCELLFEEEAGDSYRRFTLSEKYELGVVAFRLTFYRSNNGWQLEWLEWKNAEELMEKSNGKPEYLKEPLQIARTVFSKMTDGKLDGIFLEIKKYGTNRLVLLQETQTLEKISLTERLNVLNGNSATGDFEWIGWESFGDSLVRLSFVHPHKTIGNSCSFVFYRAKEEWKIVDFTINIEHRNPEFFARRNVNVEQEASVR